MKLEDSLLPFSDMFLLRLCGTVTVCAVHRHGCVVYSDSIMPALLRKNLIGRPDPTVSEGKKKMLLDRFTVPFTCLSKLVYSMRIESMTY
jgi:hypothetical protein